MEPRKSASAVNNGNPKAAANKPFPVVGIGASAGGLEAMVNATREPMLDPDLTVQSSNQAFYHTFHVTPDETLNRHIYNLGNGQWDIPKLRTLLEEILPLNSSIDGFQVDHNFPQIGLKQLLLNARRVTCEEKKTRLVLLAIEDVTGRNVNAASSI